MKKMLIIAIIFLGCSESVEEQKDITESGLKMRGIAYVKDKKTNLCFAAVRGHGYSQHSLSITEVPCDSVKEYVKEMNLARHWENE